MPEPSDTGEHLNWPERLREAAAWFDTVDELLAVITVTADAPGKTERLIDRIGAGREIQDDLLRLADAIACHDADRELGRCAAPIAYYVPYEPHNGGPT